MVFTKELQSAIYVLYRHFNAEINK